MAAIEPTWVGTDPAYPYEKLTDKVTANIQRLRDRQMVTLRRQNEQLQHQLWSTQRRLVQIESLLQEMGIDINVMLATKKVFDE